jgi:hypothetical protein
MKARDEIDDEHERDVREALDPAHGGAPQREVERDEGPLSPSPTSGGSGGSGSRAVVPPERDRRKT